MRSEASEQFPKSDRILKRDAFVRTYAKGRKVQARYFTAFVLPNPGGKPRIGITTTRKIGNSVERNRARRLVREVFRKNKWLVPSGVDIVINVKKPLSKLVYPDLESDFLAFVEKVGKK
ncbi:MAG TPA: ribonuclease P protein component [Blastocatellia bacterium]|nr:ribonuclease P protein component [Blastocatellia bacterium]